MARSRHASGGVRPDVTALVEAARSFALATDQHVAAVAGTHGLDATALTALGVLLERTGTGQPSGPADLRRSLGLTSGATTALIDRLERSGHLVRRPDPIDRRRVRLELQPKAMRDGQEMFLPLVQAMDTGLHAVADADLRTAAAVLRLLTAATSAATPGPATTA